MAIPEVAGISWPIRIYWRLRSRLRAVYQSVAGKLIGYGQPIYTDMPGIWRSYGAHIGNNVHIDPSCYVDRSFANLLEVQDDSVTAMGVVFILHDSSVNNVAGGPLKVGRIVVGAGAYIGAFSMILPGVAIGRGAIVGAGSLVTSNVPPGTVAMGRPARVLCSVEELRHRFLAKAAMPSEMITYMPFPSQKQKHELPPEEMRAWTYQSLRNADAWLDRVKRQGCYDT